MSADKASEDLAAARRDGRRDAERFHADSEARGVPFETDGRRVGLPFMWADGGGPLAMAYAGGYSARAQELTG